MAEVPEHRPTTERANGGAGGATPCSPTDQWQCAPAPGPPQPGEEAGRRPLAPPRSPLTRCLVALSSCSKPRGRVGGRRGPCRVPSSLPALRGLRAHGDPGALPQLRGVQLFAPAAGPVHPERAPGQDPEDSGQGRQPGPSR